MPEKNSTVTESVQYMSNLLLRDYPIEDVEYISALIQLMALYAYKQGIKETIQQLNDEIPREEIL